VPIPRNNSFSAIHHLSLYLACWGEWPDLTCGTLDLGLWPRTLVAQTQPQKGAIATRESCR
jgi:hypothetical protein